MTFIGRKTTFQIGRETTYGTEASSFTTMCFQEVDISPINEILIDNQACGIREDASGSRSGSKYCEFKVKGICSVSNIGDILYGALGAISTSADDPVAGANTHTFTVSQTGAPGFTLKWGDDVQTGSAVQMIRGARLNTLVIEAQSVDWVTWDATFIGKFPEDSTATFASSKEAQFTTEHLAVKFAANIAGLSGATAIKLNNFTITIENNIFNQFVFGSLDLEAAIPQQFMVTGAAELRFEDETYYDLYKDNTKQAISFTLTHEDYITGTTPYSLEFELAQAHLFNWKTPKPIDEIVLQTFEWKGEYLASATKMISAELINGTASY